MGNMSYCRFENTLRDLGDCRDALDLRGEAAISSLDTEEKAAAIALVELCEEIAHNYRDTAKKARSPKTKGRRGRPTL